MILQKTIPVNINTIYIKNKMLRKYGIRCEIGDTINIPWEDIRKTKHRTQKLLLSCDECNLEFFRRIRDLNDDVQLCRSCLKSGKRNPMFGKPASRNSKIAVVKWMSTNGNPFSKKDVMDDIKIHWKKYHPVPGMTGKSHSIETKNKMSEIALTQFVSGERVVSHKYGKIVTKFYKNIKYQSTYELKFLEYVDELGYLNFIDRGPRISYIFENKEHSYFSDYMIKNTNVIFEIKSLYTWKTNLEINIKKQEYAEKLYLYNLIFDNNFITLKNILELSCLQSINMD
jgi:hypothetical protein